MTSAQPSTFGEPDRAPDDDDVATDFDETRARPRLPRDDFFYQPPADYQRAAPGSILRSRKVTLAFLGRIRQRVSATQLLYRTTDFLGNPSVAVTTVLAPDGAPGGLLSYQCAIDAVSDRCFPSYALRHGARAAGALAQFEYLLIVAALAEGWTLSIPDHESRDGRWGVPREPGYIALDGLRAVLSDNSFGLSADAPVGIWGYSGGGLASAWASEMHQSYAPELNVVGAALGSPVGDPGHTFRRLNGTLYAALPGLVVAALSRVYPALRAVIDDHVTERGKRLLDAISSMTTVPALVRMAGRDMGRLVDQPLDDILGKPEIETIFEEIKLGKQAPTHPVLIVQAVHDRIIAAEDIDALAATYVAGGTAVTYHRDRCSEHLLLHALSAPMSLRWLADRAAGQRVEPERQGRPLLARRATYRGLCQIALVCLRVLVGRGPGRRA